MGRKSRTAWETLIAEAEWVAGLLKELDPPPSCLLILVEGRVVETVLNPHLLTLGGLRRMADSLAQRYPKAKRVILRLKPPPPLSPWSLLRKDLPQMVEGLKKINPPFLVWEVNGELLPPFPWAGKEEKHGGAEEYLKAILDEMSARYPTPPWHVALYAAWPGQNGFYKAELGYFHAGRGWMDIIIKKNEVVVDLVELDPESF